MIRLLLIFFLLPASLKAAGLDDLTWEIADGEVTIVDCRESASGDLVIPSIIEGLSVTTIGERAFANCTNLTRVEISDSVLEIESYAFDTCVNLAEVILPTMLTRIDDGLFAYCWRLRSVVIPEDVTSIGGWAFSQCQSLTHIEIPDSVTSIGSYAFQYCPDDLATVFGPGLQFVTFGQGLISIGDYAFYEGTGLREVTIPASTTYIGHLALNVWGGDVVFDGEAPDVPAYDPDFWFPPMAGRIHVWPQHLDSFDSDHYLWSQSKIVVRDTSPKIASLIAGEEIVTINITGNPDASYVCKTSSDLETFSLVTTHPEVLTLDSTGKMEFTVVAGDAGKFFVIEELP